MIWRRTDFYNRAEVYFLGVTENVKSALSFDRILAWVLWGEKPLTTIVNGGPPSSVGK